MTDADRLTELRWELIRREACYGLPYDAARIRAIRLEIVAIHDAAKPKQRTMFEDDVHA